MSAVEMLHKQPDNGKGVVARSQAICIGLEELYQELQKLRDLLRGANAPAIDHAHEPLSNSLSGVVDTQGRYLAMCQRMAADLKEIF